MSKEVTLEQEEVVQVVPEDDEVRETAIYTLVSLVPFPIREEKPGLYPSRYDIPASDMKMPQTLHIAKATHFVYLDESRGSLQVRNPVDEVADAIVRDYVTAQLGITGDAYPAFFSIPGKLKRADILIKYRNRVASHLEAQNRWFLNICRIADDDWSRYQKHSSVGDFQRVAARALGWNVTEHPWMSVDATVQSTRCPACQTPVPIGVVVCGSCHCVLDPEKFKTLQFAVKQ